MKKFLFAIFLVLAAFSCKRQNCETPNRLTEAEVKEGWSLLFDGQNTSLWRSVNVDSFPSTGWEVKDGNLLVLGKGGDIITRDEYSKFHLKADFKFNAGANSGIKYYVFFTYDSIKNIRHPLGLEYQVLDDSKHPDANKGNTPGSRTVSSLYDLIVAKNKTVNPAGEWNHAEIISDGTHVEHWLNGTKVVEYERGSDAFRALVANSKYKDIPHFGEALQGPILIQDHGDTVYYRNIKIKLLN